MKHTIFPIKAFSDNYIWCIHDSINAVIIDPGDSSQVINYLEKHHLNLTTILITHHHYDHIDGVQKLSEIYKCEIFKPNESRIPNFNKSFLVKENDSLYIDCLDLELKIFNVPGHTLSHIAYYNHDLLFCGDTLFSLGCGRLFEGTPKQMLESMNKLKSLNNNTLVYCTHEYTLSNLNFSLTILPEDKYLLDAKQEILIKRASHSPTLPTTIGFEKLTNLFLRTNEPQLINKLKLHCNDDLNNEVAVFAALRQLKDEF